MFPPQWITIKAIASLWLPSKTFVWRFISNVVGLLYIKIIIPVIRVMYSMICIQFLLKETMWLT
ncbi:hypothetical protein [Dyadobacter pollutisoli]|uniref:Uncharacterized protein n=1 Tax=Dyadobacter pollutisoli TaxID=2910158 RepID=A0A9E8N9A3_9BACT|nr:hypothetical protein [Dyadobacter pollutisoli]WAC12325.1 hypothetical protein ON006_31945 [Dyadobacter pollutisoli]